MAVTDVAAYVAAKQAKRQKRNEYQAEQNKAKRLSKQGAMC